MDHGKPWNVRLFWFNFSGLDHATELLLVLLGEVVIVFDDGELGLFLLSDVSRADAVLLQSCFSAAEAGDFNRDNLVAESTACISLAVLFTGVLVCCVDSERCLVEKVVLSEFKDFVRLCSGTKVVLFFSETVPLLPAGNPEALFETDGFKPFSAPTSMFLLDRSDLVLLVTAVVDFLVRPISPFTVNAKQIEINNSTDLIT